MAGTMIRRAVLAAVLGLGVWAGLFDALQVDAQPRLLPERYCDRLGKRERAERVTASPTVRTGNVWTGVIGVDYPR